MTDNFIPICLFIAATALLIVISRIFIFYNFTIKGWMETEATVVRQGPVSDGDGGWENEIVYEYFVSGCRYENNTYTKNFKSSVPLRHQVGFNDEYAKGSKVPVFYNPAKPEVSLLDNTFSSSNYIAVFVSITFYIVGFYYYK